jgi:hypothetical protein
MNCQGFLNSCLRRPPGWPLLEALVIVAVILLAILVVEALAALIVTL